jgi:hypothetical protein
MIPAAPRLTAARDRSVSGTLALSFGLAVTSLAPFWADHLREPTYNGRKLSRWLVDAQEAEMMLSQSPADFRQDPPISRQGVP